MTAQCQLLSKHSKGFTLIEIVIVISILGLLAGFAFILSMNAFISSNESAAQSALDTLRTAMEKYRMINYTYPPDLATLGSATPSYIDSALASGTRRGYSYTLSNISANTYTITAAPVTLNVTGKKTFMVDQSGQIWEQPSGT